MKILGYQYPQYRKDRNKYGSGKTVFLKEGLIARRFRDFEGDTPEIICLELTICDKIWFIIFAYYRLPINNNRYIFFGDISNFLNRAAMKYDNLLVIGDLNIDTLNKKKDNGNYFSDLCDSFSLKNLMAYITCVLTNKIRSF